MKIDFWIQKKKLDGLTSITYIYAWSDVGVSTWTPVRWLSKSPCMASFSLSDFTGVAYRNRFRYVMTLKWSTEESDSSDALRIGSTPILFPASIATSSSQNVKLRPLFTQNKIIISNYYSNTESKLDFLMPWFHQFSLNTNFGVAELIHEIKCYFSKWTLCWHFLGHIASKCLIIQLH